MGDDRCVNDQEVEIFQFEQWSVKLEEWVPARRLATAERIAELIPARAVGPARRVNRSELDNGFWPSSLPADELFGA